MSKVHNTRRPAGVKQWKQELELLRSEIGQQHDLVIERMRAGETSLLEALYSFAQSSQSCFIRRGWKRAAGPGVPPELS